jgi:hypothetical protein
VLGILEWEFGDSCDIEAFVGYIVVGFRFVSSLCSEEERGRESAADKASLVEI